MSAQTLEPVRTHAAQSAAGPRMAADAATFETPASRSPFAASTGKTKKGAFQNTPTVQFPRGGLLPLRFRLLKRLVQNPAPGPRELRAIEHLLLSLCTSPDPSGRFRRLRPEEYVDGLLTELLSGVNAAFPAPETREYQNLMEETLRFTSIRDLLDSRLLERIRDVKYLLGARFLSRGALKASVLCLALLERVVGERGFVAELQLDETQILRLPVEALGEAERAQPRTTRKPLRVRRSVPHTAIPSPAQGASAATNHPSKVLAWTDEAPAERKSVARPPLERAPAATSGPQRLPDAIPLMPRQSMMITRTALLDAEEAPQAFPETEPALSLDHSAHALSQAAQTGVVRPLSPPLPTPARRSLPARRGSSSAAQEASQGALAMPPRVSEAYARAHGQPSLSEISFTEMARLSSSGAERSIPGDTPSAANRSWTGSKHRTAPSELSFERNGMGALAPIPESLAPISESLAPTSEELAVADQLGSDWYSAEAQSLSLRQEPTSGIGPTVARPEAAPSPRAHEAAAETVAAVSNGTSAVFTLASLGLSLAEAEALLPPEPPQPEIFATSPFLSDEKLEALSIPTDAATTRPKPRRDGQTTITHLQVELQFRDPAEVPESDALAGDDEPPSEAEISQLLSSLASDLEDAIEREEEWEDSLSTSSLSLSSREAGLDSLRDDGQEDEPLGFAVSKEGWRQSPSPRDERLELAYDGHNSTIFRADDGATATRSASGNELRLEGRTVGQGLAKGQSYPSELDVEDGEGLSAPAAPAPVPTSFETLAQYNAPAPSSDAGTNGVTGERRASAPRLADRGPLRPPEVPLKNRRETIPTLLFSMPSITGLTLPPVPEPESDPGPPRRFDELEFRQLEQAGEAIGGRTIHLPPTSGMKLVPSVAPDYATTSLKSAGTARPGEPEFSPLPDALHELLLTLSQPELEFAEAKPEKVPQKRSAEVEQILAARRKAEAEQANSLPVRSAVQLNPASGNAEAARNKAESESHRLLGLKAWAKRTQLPKPVPQAPWESEKPATAGATQSAASGGDTASTESDVHGSSRTTAARALASKTQTALLNGWVSIRSSAAHLRAKLIHKNAESTPGGDTVETKSNLLTLRSLKTGRLPARNSRVMAAPATWVKGGSLPESSGLELERGGGLTMAGAHSPLGHFHGAGGMSRGMERSGAGIRGTAMPVGARNTGARRTAAARRSSPTSTYGSKNASAAPLPKLTSGAGAHDPNSDAWISRATMVLFALTGYFGLQILMNPPISIEPSGRYQVYAVDSGWGGLPVAQARRLDDLLMVTVSPDWMKVSAETHRQWLGHLARYLIGRDGVERIVLLDPHGAILSDVGREVLRVDLRPQKR